MKKIITSINEKWLDTNGVLRMKVIDGAFIDLPSLIEDAKVNKELTAEKPLVLYDATAYFTITPEAREYLRSGILNESRLATAVVTNQLGVRILINFINSIRKPTSPLKMFKCEQEALTWLNSFKVSRSQTNDTKKSKIHT